MCGIAGIISLGEKTIDINKIYSMMDAQKHRGPDDEGAAAFSLQTRNYREIKRNQPTDMDNWKGVVGFNRLSILDTSYAGHQPMIDNREKLILVFNGEIYNAFELKEKYLYNNQFSSKTDTEVILKMYLRFGFFKMLRMLNGMFAFCLIDINRGKVYLARDRFGIIPLYISVQNSILYFASEYKSILALKEVKRTINLLTISEYLNFRSSLSRTMVKEIYPFEAGTNISIDIEGKINKTKFFDIDYYYVPDNRKDTSRKLEEELKSAIERQLISDVPLGCQLSGGIDSSFVSSIACKMAGKTFNTFSIIFEDARFSEEKWIDTVGKETGAPLCKIVLNQDDFIDLVRKGVWHEEAILTHPSTIGIYKLTNKAKETVTVLLSGEGADECFAGYPRFGLSLLEDFSAERCIRATTTIPENLRKDIFPEIEDSQVFEERISLFKTLGGSNFDKQRKYEILTYLPELLMRQNKISMANSIENRVPFLDNEVVNYAMTFNEKTLMGNGDGEILVCKLPLKKLAEKYFGREFAYRRKIGFSVPIQNYIKSPEFRAYFYDEIMPKLRERGIFNSKKMVSLYEAITPLKYDYHDVECFWRVLTAEIWCQMYLNGNV